MQSVGIFKWPVKLADKEAKGRAVSQGEQIRWILILNRRMRGPLSTADVKVLLEQRIARMNDIACLAPSPGTNEKTEWKFLWQFKEFDRRGGRAAFDGTNRRKDRSGTEVQESVEALLKKVDPNDIPEELRDIAMTDLVVSSRRLDPRAALEKLELDEIAIANNESAASQESSRGWLLLGMMALMSSSYFIYYILKGSLAVPAAEEQKREPTQVKSTVSTPRIRRASKPSEVSIPQRGAVEKITEKEFQGRKRAQIEDSPKSDAGFKREEPLEDDAEDKMLEGMEAFSNEDSDSGEASTITPRARAKAPPSDTAEEEREPAEELEDDED